MSNQQSSTTRKNGSQAHSVRFSFSSPSFSTTNINNMDVIVVNANSVKGKRAEIADLCNNTRPDVTVVTETKIDNTINAAEFFPRNTTEAEMSGIPQGTVLGPLLFILYINDLPAQVHSATRCRLFADGCLLYRVIHSAHYQIQTQDDLKNLQQWATDWCMVFNPSKCFLMTISRGSTHLPHFYELCGVVLKCVESEKYLGVTVSHDLTWGFHITKITTNANQNLGFIKQNLEGSPRDLNPLAYIALVRSGLE